MRTDSLVLPGAILIGSGIIAAGLYFGLKASAPGPVTQGAPAAQTAAAPERASATAEATASLPPATASATGTQAPAATGTVDADAVRKRVFESAKAALEKEKREKFIPICWEPAIKANPDPPTSRHVLALGFDAEGRENLRGVNDTRGESRTDVSTCLAQRVPMGIRISPPPGINVNVEVPVQFP